MNLGDYLHPKCVVTQLEVGDKWELLREVADLFDRSGVLEDQPVSKADVLEVLVKREESQSTGLGGGIAIPHARIPGFKGMAVAMLTLKTPVSYDALDGLPVRILWIILVAEDKPTLALQAYSKIYELMQDQAIRSYFEAAAEDNLIWAYICERRLPVGGALTARDIMRPTTIHILPQTPLRSVVSEMCKNHSEAVAVEDTGRHMLGEITSDRLFQFGIPDFFNQLQSVGFISRFDPFEKYFSGEALATAGDVMQQDFAAVQPDSTMLEVVFQLTVKKHLKVYVIDEGHLIGTIDRTEVLDRILGF